MLERSGQTRSPILVSAGRLPNPCLPMARSRLSSSPSRSTRLSLPGPSAASWSKPLILYSVVPDESDDDDLHVKALNRRTQEAAVNIMQNPALNGKTIVMVWEH